jgi:hypothetical protein
MIRGIVGRILETLVDKAFSEVDEIIQVSP